MTCWALLEVTSCLTTPAPCYPRNYQMVKQDVTSNNAQQVIDMSAADLEVEYDLDWSGNNSDVISCTADSVCQQRWALVLRLTDNTTQKKVCYQVTMHADVNADLFTILDDHKLG